MIDTFPPLDVLATAAAWMRQGEAVAVATVVRTWGSAPCPSGSRMAITPGGRIAGSVSGGCIEGAVAEAGVEALRSGLPRLLTFGITNERAWEVGLACGGEIQVYVAPVGQSPAAISPGTIAALIDARAAGLALVLATRLSDGFQTLEPGGAAPPAVQAAAAQAIARDESRLIEEEGETWFVHVHAPAWRLIVVGAVHIAQCLAPLAARLGEAVTVVDPRRAFATPERFPGVALAHDWPDTAVEALRPDRRTALVTLSHDPKLDDPALDRALRGEAYYVGALGSRKTQAARQVRLAALGHDAAALARLRGPVGLAIGAVAPAEIALSILGEMVAVRRGAALGLR